MDELEKNWHLCNEAIYLYDFNKPIPLDNPYIHYSMEERDDEINDLSEQIKNLTNMAQRSIEH
jgi:hypothetical protein